MADKKIFFILFLLLIVLFIFGIIVYTYITDRLILLEERIERSNITTHSDTIMRIAVIGDSWADNGKKYKLVEMIDNKFKQEGIKASTNISGMQGAKTSQIYQNMFDDSTSIGTKKILSTQPSYCILLMGLNDLNGQYGPRYYTHHTLLIVKHLNSKHIIPIIFNIPNVNYLNIYNKYPLYKKISYMLLSLSTSGSTKLNNRNLYIEKLRETLSEANVTYIMADASFLNNNKSVYLEDDIHLNEKGYYELSNNICKCIINHRNP